MNTTPNYTTGSTITYETFTGDSRTVLVTEKHEFVKNGRAGFDGVLPNGDTVWGYDDQITRCG